MDAVLKGVRFMQKGTMCFGDLYLKDGFVERIDYQTPKPFSPLAIPGFVDVHTHGFRGISTTCDDPEKLRQLAIAYASRGIVGFVATLDPMPLSEYERIFTAYRTAFQGEYEGARFYGIHLEGPYLNEAEANDLDHHQLQSIDLKELEDFLWKNSDVIKIMSIAPELPNGMEAIAMLRRFDIHGSLAHSDASYEECLTAFEHGLDQITHLGNAMKDINHHEAGILDAVFLSNCLCELNFDGVHIQKPMLSWLLKLLGSKRIMAISDGSAYSGFEYPDGYVLDETHVVKNDAIYCHDILCNSFRDLYDAFRYLYQELEYPIDDCIAICSTNAAQMLKTLNYDIVLGRKADLVVLDHNCELQDVMIHGKYAR